MLWSFLPSKAFIVIVYFLLFFSEVLTNIPGLSICAPWRIHQICRTGFKTQKRNVTDICLFILYSGIKSIW